MLFSITFRIRRVSRLSRSGDSCGVLVTIIGTGGEVRTDRIHVMFRETGKGEISDGRKRMLEGF